jgi:GT2 family glycosyltransferase
MTPICSSSLSHVGMSAGRLPLTGCKLPATRYARTPDHMLGGRALNALPDNLFSTTSQLMTDAVYAYYNDDPRQAHFFTTNNLALPADRFRAIGGFDTTFPLAASEDREFCDRWLHHGYQMTYAPRGRGLPRPRTDMSQLLASAFQVWPRCLPLPPSASPTRLGTHQSGS